MPQKIPHTFLVGGFNPLLKNMLRKMEIIFPKCSRWKWKTYFKPTTTHTFKLNSVWDFSPPPNKKNGFPPQLHDHQTLSTTTPNGSAPSIFEISRFPKPGAVFFLGGCFWGWKNHKKMDRCGLMVWDLDNEQLTCFFFRHVVLWHFWDTKFQVHGHTLLANKWHQSHQGNNAQLLIHKYLWKNSIIPHLWILLSWRVSHKLPPQDRNLKVCERISTGFKNWMST